MKGSWAIARVRGIEIRVHLTFLLLLLWIGGGAWLQNRRIEDALASIALIGAVFVCVVLHELGHALAARRYDIATSDITLLPIGGIARLKGMPPTPKAEIVVALAGPAVNVAIAAFLWLWLASQGEPAAPETPDGSFLGEVLWINVSLAAFNLIPAFPMDGGRVLRALLALRLRPARATALAARIGQAIAVLIGLGGLASGQVMLALVGLFVWFGAAMESAEARMRESLSQVPLGQVLITHFVALEAHETLAAAVRATLAGTQKDFPVMDGERVVGVLTQARLLQGLREHGDGARIGENMLRDVVFARTDEPLADVWRRMQEAEGRLVVVRDGERIAGLVDLDNVIELVRIRSALAAAVRR